MGKKTRKTRWRALAIDAGDHSESEESNNAAGAQYHPSRHQLSKGYQSRSSYYSKFPYSSSQSTPIRGRFPSDAKSTRSSSMTSENKITFNEDEYTRITTPRQDVLFKKGYLNKPKTYQTQTSTGNSTISTGNSTGNGTPDHQSADGTEGTDLEYESHFVFPNGFVDQNGIYYVNSYEPYPPVLVYNAPYCFSEQNKLKTYSVESPTGSTSPHNEDTTSQDMSNSGGETANISECNRHQVFNVMYPPGYYYNTIPNVTEIESCQTSTEPRKLKKRRRRKISKPVPEGSSTEDEEEDQSVVETSHDTSQQHKPTPSPTTTNITLKPDAKEFVPRAHQQGLAPPPPLHFIPVYHYPILSDVPTAPAPFHLMPPPGIPVNYLVPEPKFVNFIPDHVNGGEVVEKKAEEVVSSKVEEKRIDMEKIVSKLEEAVKEQRSKQKQQQSPSKFKPKPKPKQSFKETRIGHHQQQNKKLQQQKSPAKKAPVEIPVNTWISVSSRKKRKNRNNVESEVDFEEEAPACASVPVDDGFEKYDVNQLIDVIPDNNKISQVPEETVNKCEMKSLENFESKAEVVITEVTDCVVPEVEKVFPVEETEEVEVPEELQEKPLQLQIQEENSSEPKINQSIETDLLNSDKERESNTHEINESPVSTDSSVLDESAKLKENIISDGKEVIEAIKIEIPQSVKVLEESDETNVIPSEATSHTEIDMLIDSLADMEVNQKKKLNNKAKKVMITDDLSNVKESPKSIPRIVKKVATVEKKKEILESPELKRNKKKKKVKAVASAASDSAISNEDKYDFLLKSSALEEEKTNVEVSEELDKIIQRGMYNCLEEKVKALNITAANDGFFKSFSGLVGYERPKSKGIFAQVTQAADPASKSTSCTNTDHNNGSFLDHADAPHADAAGVERYPITQAVKEWMTRTREATPEVELLKSPDTILRELQRHGVDDEEEVTVFSSENWSLTASFEEDSQEYWEDDIAYDKTEKAEEAIEVYESKYGQNEDFKQIQSEIEQKLRNGEPFPPKHGNLPYRAICCSLM